MKTYIFIILILSFVLIFVVPTYRIYKKTGINPVTFGKEDNAHNYVGKVFKFLILLLVVTFAVNLFDENFYRNYFVPIDYLQNSTIFFIGFALLHVAIIWIFIAQIQMGKSWRIGIDEKNKTELVTNGLFSVSRNPVFLGMMVILLSAFLILPNIFTFLTMVTGYIVIQVQIRLEEEFLEKQFGKQYIFYKSNTKRLI